MAQWRALALISVAVLVAGCSAASTTPSSTVAIPQTTTIAPCPDDGLRRSAYADAGEFFEGDILRTAFTMRLEGTMEGKVGTRMLALDAVAKSVRVSDGDTDVRVVGTFYSVSSGDTKQYGRNHQAGAQYEGIVEILQASIHDAEPDFLDDLGVDDYTATCMDQGGVQAIRYSYQKDGRKDVKVVERIGKHRPLSGESVDPAMQDNYRASMSYATPTITVDATLPKVPITAIIEPITYAQNARGGLTMVAEMKAGTAWAPFGEILTQIVGTDGTVYAARVLQAGIWQLGDGDLFEYQDKDANGILSTGDRFSMDLGPGLDVAFFDAWANTSVGVKASA